MPIPIHEKIGGRAESDADGGVAADVGLRWEELPHEGPQLNVAEHSSLDSSSLKAYEEEAAGQSVVFTISRHFSRYSVSSFKVQVDISISWAYYPGVKLCVKSSLRQ